MPKPGDHIIKESGAPKRGEVKTFDDSQNSGAESESGGVFLTVISIFLFVMLVYAGVQKLISLGTPSQAQQSTSAVSLSPQPPSPPSPYSAVFSGVDSSGIRVEFVISGGRYIVYEVAQSVDSVLAQHSGKKVFVFDYKKKKAKGDFYSADVVVLVGAVDVGVNDIYEGVHLAGVIASGNFVEKAIFKYSNSPRGPPGSIDEGVKRIVVVGKIANISMPSTFKNAYAEAKVIDLEPSERDIRIYNDELRMYKARKDKDEWDKYNKMIEDRFEEIHRQIEVSRLGRGRG